MNQNIASIRREYLLQELSKSSVDKDPLVQFDIWLREAVSAKANDPTAMALSTVNSRGMPSSRIVLLKDIDKTGFSFFTNYESKKGLHLTDNNQAALLFFWPELERQIRVEGTVIRVPDSESDNYFSTRPKESNIGAWASRQSAVIPSRQQLEDEFSRYSRKFNDGEIPRPYFWGGYKLTPLLMEFWQGRSGRLHDRIQYSYRDDIWSIARLSP